MVVAVKQLEKGDGMRVLAAEMEILGDGLCLFF